MLLAEEKSDAVRGLSWPATVVLYSWPLNSEFEA